MISLPDLHLFFDPNSALNAGQQKLIDSEAHHAVHVLRLKPGNEIMVTNGQGNIWLAEVLSATRSELYYKATALIRSENVSPYTVSVACGSLGSASRMEMMVEKLVEIGVHEIAFYSSERTGKHKLNLARLEKVAVSAVKQSRKSFVPNIKEVNLEYVLHFPVDHKLIASCIHDKLPHIAKIETSGPSLVVIGPEGDFTQNEIQSFIDNGFTLCSLGDERLRSETAAIYALICQNLKYRT